MRFIARHKFRPISSFSLPVFAVKTGIICGCLVFYEILLSLLLPTLYLPTTALASLLVLMCSWFLSCTGGLILAAGLSFINYSLSIQHLPGTGTLYQAINSSIGFVILVIISCLVAHLRSTRDNMRKELIKREQAEEALRESELRYHTLFNHAGDAIFISTPNGRIIEVNEVTCQRLGYSREELLELDVDQLEPAANKARLAGREPELLQKGKLLFETTLKHRDGSQISVELNVRMIDFNHQRVMLSIARDISQRKAIEQSEREQRMLAESLRDIAADLTSTLQLEEVLDRILENMQRVIQHDAASIMLLDNGLVQMTRHHGYQQRAVEVPPNHLQYCLEEFPTLEWMAMTRRPLFLSDTQKNTQWRSLSFNAWVRSYAGVPIVFKGRAIGFLNVESETPGQFTREHTGRLLIFAYHAAVAIQNARLYAEVQRTAMLDELTKLYNRRGLMVLGEQEAKQALLLRRPLAALLIDVDHFKNYNDFHSYAVGDEVLTQLAQRLKENAPDSSLVCRYGGDEFIILVAEDNPDELHSLAGQIHNAVHAAPFETNQGPLMVTVSIGISILNQVHWDLAALIEAAGNAVHVAKQAGRNQTA